MSDQTIADTLIHAAAIGGIGIFWLQFTAKAVGKVVQLSNEMFANKGRRRKKKTKKNTRRGKKNTIRNNKKRRSRRRGGVV